ncbi:MAG: hypothetical protein M3362_08915 [Acidobacteriota bacterium]|nr:hypothetical protein [Acidobacteriota bacterium]
MLFRTTLLLALMSFSLCAARGQQSNPPSPNDPISADKGAGQRHPGQDTIGSPQQEMLVRQEIKSAEKEHQENIDRAREAAQLCTELRDSFLNNKAFVHDDLKKLERLEKITRKIRSEAGGSEGNGTLDNPPTGLEAALSRLADISDKLRKGVEKTPRQVLSAAVIERANELLELIHFVRSFAH